MGYVARTWGETSKACPRGQVQWPGGTEALCVRGKRSGLGAHLAVHCSGRQGASTPARHAGRTPARSMTKLELLDHRLVTGGVSIVQVIQQAATLADHEEQSAAGAVILVVLLEMRRQLVDALRQEGNLHVCRASVFLVETKILHDLRFAFQFRTHLKSRFS